MRPLSAAPDAEALASLRVPELRDKCRARGLRVSGTKAALIERLLEADGADANAAHADAAGVDTTSNAAEEGSWASLGLDGATQQRLTHARPTPIQAAAFESLKSGKDGVLHAETGSGKTLAYALPLMKKRVLVLTPSTALADQIAEDRLLASEVRVEAAQRDARALRNRGDRRLMKSTFPELGRRCVEELAPCAPPTFRGGWGGRRVYVRACHDRHCLWKPWGPYKR